jgi:hypothetical protein
VFIVGKNLLAKNVKDLRSANIIDKNLLVKNAKGLPYVFMVGINLHAKNVRELQSANITGRNLHAKNAEVLHYVVARGVIQPEIKNMMVIVFRVLSMIRIILIILKCVIIKQRKRMYVITYYNIILNSIGLQIEKYRMVVQDDALIYC